MSRLLRRRPGPDDEGISLVELLISMVIFAVLALAVMTLTITTLRTARNTMARNDDLNKVQVAMDAMSKYIRTAAEPPVAAGGVPINALVLAGPADVRFYGYDAPGAAPSLMRFYVDASNRLIEEHTATLQCAAPYTWAPANKRTRILATNLSPAQTIFVYNTAPQGDPTPLPTGAPLPTSGSPAQVNPAVLSTIDSVAITLSVDVPTSPNIPAMTATTHVQLLNHAADRTLIPGAAC